MRNLCFLALAFVLSACATSTFTPVAVNDSGDYYLAESGYYGSYPAGYQTRSSFYGFGSWWYGGGAYSPALYTYYSPYYYPHYYTVWNFPFNNSPFAYGMYGRGYAGWGYPYWYWCPPIRGPIVATAPGQREVLSYDTNLSALTEKQSYLYAPWARNDLRLDPAMLKNQQVNPRSVPRFSSGKGWGSVQKSGYPTRSYSKPTTRPASSPSTRSIRSSSRSMPRSSPASSRGSTRIATRGSTRASGLDKN